MIANIIAALSLFVSVSLSVFYIYDRRFTKHQIESEYVKSLLDWHQNVVETLVRLRVVYGHKPSGERPIEELARLSALIDQGRFFFPNIDRSDDFGNMKPPAYRGYRNLALDFLVGSYNIFSDRDPYRELDKAALLQKYFTSVVFEIVRPRRRLEIIKKLTDRYFIEDKSFEDFWNHPDGSLIKYIWKY